MNVPTTNQNYFSATLVAVAGCLNAALTALRCVGFTSDDNSECVEHFRSIENAASTFGAKADKGLSSLINQANVPNVVAMAPSEFIVKRGEDDVQAYSSLADATSHCERLNAKNKGKCPCYVIERFPERMIRGEDVGNLEKQTSAITSSVQQPVIVPMTREQIIERDEAELRRLIVRGRMFRTQEETDELNERERQWKAETAAMSAAVQVAPAVKVPVSEVRPVRPVNPNVTKQGNTSAPLAPPVNLKGKCVTCGNVTTKGAKDGKCHNCQNVPAVKAPTSYKELVGSGADAIGKLASAYGINPADYSGKGSAVKLCAAVWAKVKGATVAPPVAQVAPPAAPIVKPVMMDNPVSLKCVCGNAYPAKGQTKCKQCLRIESSKGTAKDKANPAPVQVAPPSSPVIVTKAANDVSAKNTSGLISYEEGDTTCVRCMRWARKGSAYCPKCEPGAKGTSAVKPVVQAPVAAPKAAPVAQASKPVISNSGASREENRRAIMGADLGSKAPVAPVVVVAVHEECGATLGYVQGMSSVVCTACKCLVPTADLITDDEDDDDDTRDDDAAESFAPIPSTKGKGKGKGKTEDVVKGKGTLSKASVNLLSFLADHDDWMTQKQMSAAGHNNLGLLLVDHKTNALVVLGYAEEGKIENEKGRTVKAYRITDEGIAFLQG